MTKNNLDYTSQETHLAQLLQSDATRMQILYAVKQWKQTHTGLPPLYVSAGFIRNLYWDAAHQYSGSTPLNDVDVVYFDEEHIDKSHDQNIENQLFEILPSVNWSVKNQARMHAKSGHAPYTSLENALSNWVETATALAVKLKHNDTFEFIAPYGFADLFDLVVRPTPYFQNRLDIFHQRVKQKSWLAQWSKLQVILPVK